MVECSNCGGGPKLWVALGSVFLAASSLVVALAAAIFAKRSAGSAAESAELAREEVAMTRAEHEVWLKRMEARADLRLDLRTINADDEGVLRTTGSSVSVRVEVGVANAGELVAGQTTINVLAPRRTQNLRWCGPLGEDTELSHLRPAETDEKVQGGDGEGRQAEYLSRAIDQVGLRTPVVVHVRFTVNVPDEGERVVSLRAKASADELPEGVDEVVADHLVCVRRVRP